jgi:hypothetical protein
MVFRIFSVIDKEMIGKIPIRIDRNTTIEKFFLSILIIVLMVSNKDFMCFFIIYFPFFKIRIEYTYISIITVAIFYSDCLD